MEIDPKICHRVLKARDARFDGRFFVAVKTTGIYCRPICPAPLPRFENCEFVRCAAEAQERGYRPCLRCRPEVSPGTPAWAGSSASVSRALRLIAEGALCTGSVDELASRLGMGERHLRRLFIKHLGASPIAVEQTRRILFAKKLIGETALPMTEVAHSAGFASVRRFNDAIRKTYDRSPSQLRQSIAPAKRAGSSRDLTLRLGYRPPLDWPATLAYLKPRATPGVESVGDASYKRSLRIGDARGVLEVTQAAGENCLLARIRISSTAPLIEIGERVRQMFDLDADPARIHAQLVGDARLAVSLRDRDVPRIPGAWDGFELAVRAVLGQQVSVKGATTLAGRLARTFGEAFESDAAGVTHLFPTPVVLRQADLTRVGLTRARASAVSGLAAAIDDGELLLDAPLGLEDILERLRALPGIGDWTAQYVAMRALREPDAFPSGDLGLRKALGSGSGPVSDRELREAAEAWRPWRAYAAMHLWMSASASTGG